MSKNGKYILTLKNKKWNLEEQNNRAIIEAENYKTCFCILKNLKLTFVVMETELSEACRKKKLRSLKLINELKYNYKA